MIQGWVTDLGHGLITMGKWHAGQPRASFWFGTKANVRSGLPLGAFRCEACGFVEFYADAAYEAT
jgi:hypothetical protein